MVLKTKKPGSLTEWHGQLDGFCFLACTTPLKEAWMPLESEYYRLVGEDHAGFYSPVADFIDRHRKLWMDWWYRSF